MVPFEAARRRAPAAGALLATALRVTALLAGLSCDDSAGTEAGGGGMVSTLPEYDNVSGGTASTEAPTSAAAPGSASLPYCQVFENYGPDEPGSHGSCLFEGPEGTIWNEDDPTPPGPYRCYCTDSSSSVPDASDCNDALRKACQVDFASLPPDPCSEPNDVEHLCWPVRGNSSEWSCRCAAWEPIGVIEASSCGEAVSRYCGRCASERGSCRKSSGPREIQYLAEFDCSCGSGDAEAVNAGSLDAGTAAAGTVRHIGADGLGDCSLALALSCGYPAAGEHCEASNPGGGAFACSADGDGNWSCDCPRFNECWARSHPVDTCVPGDPTCVRATHPPPGLDRPRVCERAIYEYCQCPEP